VPQPGDLRTTVASAQTFYWEYLASQISHGFPGYSFVAATGTDSVAGSNPSTVFMVEAEETSDGLYWSSAPDSGYSVDNLPPSTPAPFTGQFASGATSLHWGLSSALDFALFRLYRGSSAGFVPSDGNLVASQSDTGYVDHAGSPYYYKLAAEDIHGNLSGFALLTPDGTLSVGPGEDVAFALIGPRPNPADGVGWTVAFSLPSAEAASLELIDITGRRLASRSLRGLAPGRHEVSMDAGRRLPPGLYFVRLAQGTRTAVTRLAIVE
jgi:hypothetical protein